MNEKIRFFIPGYGADRECIEASMKWLTDNSSESDLFLYVLDKSMVKKDSKILSEMYGEEFCKPLREKGYVVFNGKRIDLITQKTLPKFNSKPKKILALYSHNRALESLEQNVDFDELLVLSWNCESDLSGWIENYNGIQFRGYLPNNPKSKPDDTISYGVKNSKFDTFNFKENLGNSGSQTD